MIKELRKKSLVNNLIIAAVILGILAVIGICNKDNLAAYFSKPVNISDITIDDIKSGVKVEGEIKYVYDYFAYQDDKNGKVKLKDFFIDAGDFGFIAYECEGSKMYTAQKNIDVYEKYLDGEDVKESDLKTIKISGTIKQLEGEARNYYYEYLNDAELSEDDKECFLPYVIIEGSVGTLDSGDIYMLEIICVFLAVLAVGFIILGLFGSNVRAVKKFCRKQQNEMQAYNDLENLYTSETPVGGVRVNDKYFMIVNKSKAYVAESSNILWVYYTITQHRVNYIPVLKTNTLMVKKADGSQFKLNMKKKDIDAALDYIVLNMPYIFMGYDDDLLKAYKKDRDSMVREMESRRAEYYSSSENETEM